MSLKKALATLLATVMMLSLVSCGSKSNEEAPGDASKPTESAESSGKIKVGFSSAAFSDEWCHNLALAFENLTATEYPEIEATVLDGNIDAEKQINIPAPHSPWPPERARTAPRRSQKGRGFPASCCRGTSGTPVP